MSFKKDVTPRELEVLGAIWQSDFQDQDAAVGHEVWVNCLPSVNGYGLGGVMASLSKKGFVRCSGYGKDALVALTAAGLDAMWSNQPA